MKYLIKYTILSILIVLTSCTFKQSTETTMTDRTGTIPSERTKVVSAFTREQKDGKSYHAYTAKTWIMKYDKLGKFPEMASVSDFAFASIPSSYAFGGKTTTFNYGNTITKTVIHWSLASDGQRKPVPTPSKEFDMGEFLKSNKPKS